MRRELRPEPAGADTVRTVVGRVRLGFLGGIAFVLVAVPFAGAGIEEGGGPDDLAAAEITGDRQNLNIVVTSGIVQMDTEQTPPLGMTWDSTGGGDLVDETSGGICPVDRLGDDIMGATCPVPKDLDVTLAEPGTRFVQDAVEEPPFDLSLTAPKGGNNIVVNFAGRSLDIKNGEPDIVSCSTPVEQLSYDAGLDDVGCNVGSVGPVPAALTCGGLQATYVGTPGRDSIKGTKDDDVILAYGGADEINAGRGADTVCGGPGPDEIGGGAQDDLLHGNAAPDKIAGGSGDDAIVGHGGDDDCDGAGGADSQVAC